MMRQLICWLAMHGLIRGLAAFGARRGDPQGRLMADPAVWTDPIPLIEEIRSCGRNVQAWAVYLTVDHEITNDLDHGEPAG